MSQIIQNDIKCLHCGDVIYSAHVHDFKFCSCGACAVDGGLSYLRRSGKLGVDYEDLSIVIEDDLFNDCIKAFKWSAENNRNEFGTLCALFRAFRDNEYRLIKRDSKD